MKCLTYSEIVKLVEDGNMTIYCLASFNDRYYFHVDKLADDRYLIDMQDIVITCDSIPKLITVFLHTLHGDWKIEKVVHVSNDREFHERWLGRYELGELNV